MREPETDEKRIKRLEATVDALTYYLVKTNRLLFLALVVGELKSATKEEYEALKKTLCTHINMIEALKPCTRERNNWH